MSFQGIVCPEKDKQLLRKKTKTLNDAFRRYLNDVLEVGTAEKKLKSMSLNDPF